MTCLAAQDPQLERLADAIAQKVGQQRFHVWFNNSTRLDLRNDGLEIAVPNDFISEWIGKNFSRPIQEAAHEVLGCTLAVKFNVVPELFEVKNSGPRLAGATPGSGERYASKLEAASAVADENRRAATVMPVRGRLGRADPIAGLTTSPAFAPMTEVNLSSTVSAAQHHSLSGRNSFVSTTATAGRSLAAVRPRLRHDLSNFVVGPSNQLAYNTVMYVAEFPGSQYNPLFIHGNCGLGKTHLLQGLCKQFVEMQPTKRWMYMTGEEFTNEFLAALRGNKLDTFRRRMRDLDLLVIDDVHFMGGKKATQEEFLHTFNAIEAMGKQVVMASDNHPKMIEEFGESLINRFVSGMVVRIDPPNFATRMDILRFRSQRTGLNLGEDGIQWIARRVTQNVRELEGAITRIAAHCRLSGRQPDVAMVQETLGDLDRNMITPVKPENVMLAVCNYFGLENKDLMSGRRQRTISLARSVAMFLVRKTGKLSFPEIGSRMGKRNHSTVISACRRIEKAVAKNEKLVWTSSVGDREEEAMELVQRLEEHSRVLG